MPLNLCHLQNLQLLDLSINQISGSLPKCVSNFTAMRNHWSIGTNTTIEHIYRETLTTDEEINGSNHGHVQLVWKRRLSQYENTLGLVKR